MKKLAITCVVMLYSVISMAGNVHGHWKGEVMTLPIVFHIFEKDGEMLATISSPAQGATDIPCEMVTVKGDSVKIKMLRLNASFKGVLSPDENSIKGQFKQGVEVPLVLTRTTAESAMLYRPQEPKPPFVYRQEEVTFNHGEISLAGTLTMPSWGRNFPAVVLVSGSGAQNRDEELFGHKPFAVIADFLTRAGIAVLRYDDRGVGGSSAGSADDTTLDFAQDALAAVDYLKTRSEIDSKNIGIIGHSEGGTIAVICAAMRPDDVAFIVSLAGAMVKGRDVMVQQNCLLAEMSGNPLNEEQKREVETIFATIDSINEPDRLRDALKTLMASHGEARIEQSLKVMTSPWYMAFVKFDPSTHLAQVKCPFLALNGEWDAQVDATLNLEAVKRLVPSATVKSYKKMNHLFQEIPNFAQSMSYGNICQTISPIVLDDIATWVVDEVRKSR